MTEFDLLTMITKYKEGHCSWHDIMGAVEEYSKDVLRSVSGAVSMSVENCIHCGTIEQGSICPDCRAKEAQTS